MRITQHLLFVFALMIVIGHADAAQPIKGMWYIPVNPIPVPDGAWASPEHTEEWLKAIEQYAVTTGLGHAQLINSGSHQHFDKLDLTTMKLLELERAFQATRAVQELVDTEQNRLMVSMTAINGIPELIQTKGSAWARLEGLYKASQSIREVKRLWDDTQTLINRLQFELGVQKILRQRADPKHRGRKP